MRLTKIKLSGFKSFVDPTALHLSSSLVGIVGPNGCGKSNLIDAVRWVMGESSARHLRGDSMVDVIFNGSSSRKPVGQASVELIFDNSDGGLGGPYAQYNEISIKRLVGRDGQSNYFLNGSRCRRRDITDIFLGTGLGPHSYAIIEQGMIARLIEARADELRLFLEEAAGISRYKERRRETETRLRHTQDNLNRLNDIRAELGNQLQHLQGQAETARKYQQLKEQERLFKAQLQALRWRTLDQQVRDLDQEIGAQDTVLESQVAGLRAHETMLEKLRLRNAEATRAFNQVQAEFYALGSEIAREEQSLQNAKERRQHLQKDIERLERALADLRAHAQADREKCTALEEQSAALDAALQQARSVAEAADAALSQAEEAMEAWRGRWEAFTAELAGPTQAAQVERARLQHLEAYSQQLQQRRKRLWEEERHLATADIEQALLDLDLKCESLRERVAQEQEELLSVGTQINHQRESNRTLARTLDEMRGRLQKLHGRLESLHALQRAALGQSQSEASTWLQARGLQEMPRLAQQLTVEDGWEQAIECVLGQHLQAVCVDDLDAIGPAIGELKQGTLGLFGTPAPSSTPPRGELREGLGEGLGEERMGPLWQKVQAPWALDGLLGFVYGADTLAEALGVRTKLTAHESVVTRDGIWVARDWLRVVHAADAMAGVLAREREIRAAAAEEQRLVAELDTLENELEAGRRALRALEEQREAGARRLSEEQRRLAEHESQRGAQKVRLEHARARAAQIEVEKRELEQHIEASQTEMDETGTRLRQALAAIETLMLQREELQRLRETHQSTLQRLRDQARHQHEATHQTAMRRESLRSALASTQAGIERLEEQERRYIEQHRELLAALAETEEPLQTLRTYLDQHLAKRAQLEASLTQARREVEGLQQELVDTERSRHAAEGHVDGLRQRLEQGRLQRQEHWVRCETLREELQGEGFELSTLLQDLPPGINAEQWAEKLERVSARIERLGAINLAAIDEFEQQSQRKGYLDAQHADLQEAIHTLEAAIRTIDRETRQRFQQVFDQVNAGLQRLFPRLFGGGTAFLELTGEELLDAGVSIMARPPGKRISSIHLLSGGEKALTAVALVFSIFELNPAPFCMLDEVDAPLDEANVGRFCQLLREMAERVQFIFITHNKVTMEMADQLSGVTMQEAGVSRLVSVDVEQAVAMAAM
jgi:chromosome segregation protein